MALPGETELTEDLPGAFARHVVEAFAARQSEIFSLALSGGATARRCYERLASDGRADVDWWHVDVYWGDERCVPHDHVDSNYRLAREALLDQVGAAFNDLQSRQEQTNIAIKNIILVNGAQTLSIAAATACHVCCHRHDGPSSPSIAHRSKNVSFSARGNGIRCHASVEYDHA